MGAGRRQRYTPTFLAARSKSVEANDDGGDDAGGVDDVDENRCSKAATASSTATDAHDDPASPLHPWRLVQTQWKRMMMVRVIRMIKSRRAVVNLVESLDGTTIVTICYKQSTNSIKTMVTSGFPRTGFTMGSRSNPGSPIRDSFTAIHCSVPAMGCRRSVSNNSKVSGLISVIY